MNINFKNCFSIKSLTQCRIIRPQLVDKDSFQYQIRLYLLLFVGGLISYLRYVCLLTYSSVQHTLCCAFVLICLRLVAGVPNGVKFHWIVYFWLPLRYSLTFIYCNQLSGKNYHYVFITSITKPILFRIAYRSTI